MPIGIILIVILLGSLIFSAVMSIPDSFWYSVFNFVIFVVVSIGLGLVLIFIAAVVSTHYHYICLRRFKKYYFKNKRSYTLSKDDELYNELKHYLINEKWTIEYEGYKKTTFCNHIGKVQDI